MCIEIVLSVLSLGFYYYDIVKDILVLYIFSYVEKAILNGEDIRTKFDSVGGVNFNVLIAYLGVVLVTSELAIYWRINSKEHMFVKTFNVHPNSSVFRLVVKIFPMHFIFFKKEPSPFIKIGSKRCRYVNWINNFC